MGEVWSLEVVLPSIPSSSVCSLSTGAGYFTPLSLSFHLHTMGSPQVQPGKLWSSPPTHACWVNRAGCVSRSRPRLLRSASSSSNVPPSVREDKSWGPSQATLLPYQVQLPSKGSRRGERAGECLVTPAAQHMVTPLLHLLNNKAYPVSTRGKLEGKQDPFGRHSRPENKDDQAVGVWQPHAAKPARGGTKQPTSVS